MPRCSGLCGMCPVILEWVTEEGKDLKKKLVSHLDVTNENTCS
jgi:hypothetical protein